MRAIFDGIKMLGMQDHYGQWWKVEKDCVDCGKCCADVPPNWIFGVDENGICVHSSRDSEGVHFCGLRGWRPLACCGNSPTQAAEYCEVVLVKTDDPCSLL